MKTIVPAWLYDHIAQTVATDVKMSEFLQRVDFPQENLLDRLNATARERSDW